MVRLSPKSVVAEHFSLFLLLNLADYCTTACIILEGGVEVMPVARGLIELYGIAGLFFHKLFVAIGVSYLCRNMSDKAWDILNWLFIMIVVWNSIQLTMVLFDKV